MAFDISQKDIGKYIMYIYVTMHLDFTICLVLITGVARDGRCPKYQDMDGKCLGNYVFQDSYILS